MRFRIGFGYDIHRLEAGYELWLGGVKIPSEKGLVGHSDADVLIHSICDALLGAASMGDIGFHFPDTSEEFRNISSCILLQRVMHLLKEKKFSIGNVDLTLVLESPKISEYIPEMIKILSAILEVNDSDVSVKATTAEKLGYIGKEEGIESYAVALIQSE